MFLNVKGTGRQLFTINLASGSCEYRPTQHNFNPESLFTLNKITAVANIAFALGNGNDGEAIAFNPNDGWFYHASGSDTVGAACRNF